MHNDQFENKGQESPPMSMSHSFTLEQLKDDFLPLESSTPHDLPQTIPSRQRASISAQSLDQDEYLPGKLSRPLAAEDDSALSPQKTVLYLAYGSNLASKTFLGARGIKPLSQLNVVVPDLRLTFDLPGLPYIEPCFAGTHFRSTRTDQVNSTDHDKAISEKHSLLQNQDCNDGHSYKGPLIGVVYEVTLADYARIIATEGGGHGYKDIVVSCYPFPNSYEPADPIPEHPVTQPVKAHTLLSPAGLNELEFMQLQLRKQSSPYIRPSRRPAQPSVRYLKLITSGAAEHNLPLAYRAYLDQVQPYRITSLRQKIGKGIFLAIWGPLLLLTLALGRVFARPNGRSPAWVIRFVDLVFAGMWGCYDHVFVHIFGDGERTVER